ncbi:uncharacterized protein LOC134216156 [Armigeres subalbatus]|uniref:uncharacterized protein LOC134216156 n=1 Tax=Armigeres subalbatus TaxID=124917 RepID=UPI002ED35346
MPPAGSSIKKPSLKQLITRLREAQSLLQDIWEFIENFKEDTKLSQVEVRLEKLEDIWDKFSETLVEIKSHDDYKEDETYDKERREFNNRFYEAKSFLVDQAKERKEPLLLDQSVRTHDTSVQGALDNVRLPQIKLQSFNGDIDEWLNFRDLFTLLIHWKPELPEVEKFHYLNGCLQGEPRSLIDPLQVTKANYQVAWDMLLKRYNNSKQLKKRQIQSLLSLPTLSKESIRELHSLLEGFERIVRTLDQVVQPADYKDLLLMNILTSRLDPEEFSSSKENDSLDDLREFLNRRVHVLESMPTKSMDTRGVQQPPLQAKQKSSLTRTSFTSAQASGGRCVACSGYHPLFQCSSFQRLSISDRDGLLRTHSLCRNCFRPGHLARECQSKYLCRNCKGRHHTLVCFKPEKGGEGKVTAVAKGNIPSSNKEAQGAPNLNSSQAANTAATNTTVSNAAHQYSSQVLLATAVIVMVDNDGNQHLARALLDSGSESNFLTERLCQRMKVTRDKVDISVLGIGQASTRVKHRVRVVVRSRVSQFSRELDFLILPKVTVNLPTISVNIDGWSIPNGIELADPAFFESKGVDIVLGIESFFDFFETGRRISLGEHLPTLNDSVFGWVVCGGTSMSSNSLQLSCNISTSESLDLLLERFWKCEELGSEKAYSPEERRCEKVYQHTVRREQDGRYTVTLPKNYDIHPGLGKSWDIAHRRLQATERRLARDSSLREQYTAFMEEYLAMGHMSRIDQTAQATVQRCYLPHHPVVKEASTTTKVRVVFDASCKTASGVSLNDVLLVGPVIQEDLRSIILRSRTRQIILVSDVEKMFRQINICKADRPLQCILWRSSPMEEVGAYELNTVTYGTKPAPFLATRTVKQLAEDERTRFPLAARAVEEDVYMDDVITGADDVATAAILRHQLDEMMISGGFRLRKWASNNSKVLEGVSPEDLAIPQSVGVSFCSDTSVKTLGLTWVPESDVLRFQFAIPAVEEKKEYTKRHVLSVIATLFDPLGLLGAAITTAKIFMQQLWSIQDGNGQRLDWDHPLPPTVGETWKKLQNQLPAFNLITIDRCVIIPGAKTVEIHCFSDASEKAFGACVYLRSQNADGSVIVRLLTSKSRVAPLKCQSIPRLELCGALLAAQLYEKVQASLKSTMTSYFWTDSTCVLRWIQATPTMWTTYVANRVAKIQTITEKGHWRHVPGMDNPADLISRGISPGEIVANRFWWQGPRWLELGSELWPKAATNFEEEGEDERRRTVVASSASPYSEFNDQYIGRFGSYTDMIRRTAYWLRLMDLLRKPREERKDGSFLSTVELRQAENVLVRRIQKEFFSKEWKAIINKTIIPSNSPLRWYNPFISTDGIMRVGGRLNNSLETEDIKHPIPLPARHKFTRMLLHYYHERLLHAGPQLMLAVVRLRFLPLGGRSVAKQIVHECLKCFRSRPTAIQQFMGELPSSRVTVSRPFSQTGVDFFGPVYIRQVPRRPAVKAYVALFICMSTKAVHLELVTDLSTERFLQALRRFVSRRGKCSDIYSDNGTNFVGARNKLQDFMKLLKDPTHREIVSRECTVQGIQWHFNPPSAPHFGGLWEAAVRSAKKHLLKVVGENPVSPEDFTTFLVQVEGCLNSRPLTPMSEDPEDLEPLTPSHFLVGSSLQAIPEPNLEDVSLNRLDKYQLTQRKLQDFWRRWRREYLCQLQARTKRWKPPVPVEVGRLVVIKDDNVPPMRWRMGRIQELHPGADNVVRVATVKTSSGMLTRPVEKLCILPSPDCNDEPESVSTSSSIQM